MRRKFCQITIVAIGILFCLSLFPSFVFADGAAPFNNESVIKELKENIETLKQKYFNSHPGNDADNYTLAIKESYIGAFNKSGYDFSTTISKMANEGFNKDDMLFKDIIFIMIIQITGEDNADFLFKIFLETDAGNLLKIILTQDAEGRDRNLPDYNIFGRDKIDSLLRKKWKDMTAALKKGKIEEALDYFVPEKRPAYKEVFGTYPDKIKYVIETTKNMELVDFDLFKVKYVVDFEAVVDGIQTTFSSYIIFVRDKDGLWKIKFF